MEVSRAQAPAVDPRVERSRRAIREAALAELAEAGYGGFAIESVARRAGAGKSTVYRHWDGKLALIADALEALNVQPPSDLGEGGPRQRVERLLRHLAEILCDSTFSACIPALVDAAARDGAVRDFLHGYSARRRAALAAALADGVAAGAFPAHLDPDLAALALAGPLFAHRLLSGAPLDPLRVPALVDTVLGPGT